MSKKYYIYKMNTKILNVYSIILFIIMILFTVFLDRNLLIKSFWINDYLMFIFEMILYTVLHEIIHSIFYVLNGAKFKNIYFGASLEKGILYCLCAQNISKKNILISLISPLILIGIITYIVSIIYNLPRLLILSIINISGCTGDIIMFRFIKNLKNIEFSEFNSPDSFAIYTNDKLDKKVFGLDFLCIQESLDKGGLKKVNVSKVSIYVFLVLLFLGLFTV